MDLYTPGDLIPGSTRPTVIFVSGGDASADTLRTREIGLYISYGQLVAASGFVGIVFDHRGLEGYTQLREVGEDTDDLVMYVCTHAASLGVNPQRLCLWAFSAGPIYCLRTAFRTALPSIRCAIAYYGGMSLLNKRYFHYTEEEEPLLREFSPVCSLHDSPARIPPLLVARAALDKPFLNESIDEFVRLAVAKNVPITLVNHPEGMHGFDMRNDDERSREIIRMTLEFIKMHLGEPEREWF